jgi:acetoacetate decarboxylase
MLKSRVILTGIAVAAAAAAGSAFTAANTFAPSVEDGAVGYGEYTVSGATVSKVVYTPNSDVSKLDSIVFTSTSEITSGNEATMYLKDGSTPTAASDSTCVLGTWGTPTTGEQTITCTFDTAVEIATFNTVALSISPA